MKVYCSNPKCWSRRVHHERQDTPRGQQIIEVLEDHEGCAFCSITCACEAGYYNVREGFIKDPLKGELRKVEDWIMESNECEIKRVKDAD